MGHIVRIQGNQVLINEDKRRGGKVVRYQLTLAKVHVTKRDKLNNVLEQVYLPIKQWRSKDPLPANGTEPPK